MKRLWLFSLFALLFACIAGGATILADGSSFGREGAPTVFYSGSRLAEAMVIAARLNHGVINIDPSAKLCVAPDSWLARNAFPDAAVQFVESDESDMAWYAAVLNGEGWSEIYEINNGILDWDIEGARHPSLYSRTPVRNLVICPTRIIIELDGATQAHVIEFKTD